MCGGGSVGDIFQAPVDAVSSGWDSVSGGLGDFFQDVSGAPSLMGTGITQGLDFLGNQVGELGNLWDMTKPLIPYATALGSAIATAGASLPVSGAEMAGAGGAGALGELAGAEMAPSLFGDYALGSSLLGEGAASSMIPLAEAGGGAWAMPGVLGLAEGAGAGAATGSFNMTNPSIFGDYNLGSTTLGGEATTGQGTSQSWSMPGVNSGGGGIMNFLKNNRTPLQLGAGLLSNYLGKSAQAGQTGENLQDYLNQTTWTPGRAGAYQSGVAQNVAGTAGRAGARAKGTVAEQLAGAGRGGGRYGQSIAAIDENVLNQIAQAKNQALTTTSTPSNVSAAPFMAQSNATADTLTGLGGMFGNMATTDASLEFLKRLGLFNGLNR